MELSGTGCVTLGNTRAHLRVDSTHQCACGAQVWPWTASDYRALLKKYISHLRSADGMAYLQDDFRTPDLFTDDEWAELQRLDH